MQQTTGDEKESYLDLLIELATLKHQYNVIRRPLVIYRNLVLFAIFLLAAAVTANALAALNSYISGWITFVIVVCVILLIGLTIYFLLDATIEGDRHGFRGFSRIRELLSLKKDIEEKEVSAQFYQQHQTTYLSIEEQAELYKDDLLKDIREYQRKANRNRWVYFTLQMVIIACSLLVGGLTSGLSSFIPVFGNHFLAPVLSFSVSFLTAMITLFRPRERGYNLQQTADAIQFEIDCATRRIYGYKGLSSTDAYVKFAEEAERLRNEQRKRQQQLEQASDVKQTT